MRWINERTIAYENGEQQYLVINFLNAPLDCQDLRVIIALVDLIEHGELASQFVEFFDAADLLVNQICARTIKMSIVWNEKT